MSDIEAANINKDEVSYHYGLLWVCTILFGFIGLVIADIYINEVTIHPESSKRLLSNFREFIDWGNFLFVVLFYFYFKALNYGMKRQKYISTFIKLTIWSVIVVFAKLVLANVLALSNGSAHSAYFAASLAHLDFLTTLGVVVFPVVTLFMIITLIGSILKKRATAMNFKSQNRTASQFVSLLTYPVLVIRSCFERVIEELKKINKNRKSKKAREELLSYKLLLDEGLITKDEFSEKSSRLKMLI